jgi:serine/threonine protein phosphatase PrpC
MLTGATESTPGKVRTNNEDSLLWDQALGLVAVADGMGGHNAGEVASRLAVEALQKFLAASASDATVAWPFGVDSTASPGSNRVRTGVRLANREVFRSAEERPEWAGMGTTLTAALVEGARVLFANVGDSRLYAYPPGGAFQQKTRDDSLMGMLADAPGVDVAALEDHPMKHLLTNVLGRKADLEIEVTEATLEEGEILLLCSDGMHGSLSDDAMRAMLDAEPDLQQAAKRLVQAALDAGSRDNVSVVLARYTAT